MKNNEKSGQKKEKKCFLVTVLGAVSGSFKKDDFSVFFYDFLLIVNNS